MVITDCRFEHWNESERVIDVGDVYPDEVGKGKAFLPGTVRAIRPASLSMIDGNVIDKHKQKPFDEIYREMLRKHSKAMHNARYKALLRAHMQIDKPKPKSNRVTTNLKRPSIRTLEKWMMRGVAKATDGCEVEPDGECPHGCKSWLIVMGYIQ